jgi:hypothetical protein
MWLGGRDRTVSCIACGASLSRSEAREYDKEGNRWDRNGKRFEYLCKGCFRDLSKEPRDGVESTLVEIGAGNLDREEFLSAYAAAEDREREAD